MSTLCDYLARSFSYHLVLKNCENDPHIEMGCLGWVKFKVSRAVEPGKGWVITEGSFDSNRADMLWICRIFSRLISF